MKNRKRIFSAFIVIAALSSFLKPAGETVTVSGIVVSDQTGKPLPAVLVYVTEGEEEALTKEKGEFRVETAKKLPFTVTAEHWEYEKRIIRVTGTDKKLIIRMVKKGE